MIFYHCFVSTKILIRVTTSEQKKITILIYLRIGLGDCEDSNIHLQYNKRQLCQEWNDRRIVLYFFTNNYTIFIFSAHLSCCWSACRALSCSSARLSFSLSSLRSCRMARSSRTLNVGFEDWSSSSPPSGVATPHVGHFCWRNITYVYHYMLLLVWLLAFILKGFYFHL